MSDEENQEFSQQEGEFEVSRDGSGSGTVDGDAAGAGAEDITDVGGEATENGGATDAPTTTSSDVPLGTKMGARGDDDDKKIFVGGLHWETTAADMKDYFNKFGTVIDCTLKTDQVTGKSRGFGFVLFDNSTVVEKILADKSHSLRGRNIDCKRAQSAKAAAGKSEPIKKVFVGGLNPDLPESEIREYFGQFGKIEEVELPFDKSKNQRRAFCFITFETEEMVDKAVVNAKQKIGDREVDVRKATPKSEQDSSKNARGGMMGRGGARGGYNAQYPGYGGAPGYDYSNYYGMASYYGYPGYAPYDYSGYYGQAGDWSAYSGYAAYPGYDYSSYYAAGGQGQMPGASAAPGGGGANNYKAKRGGPPSGGSAGGYHPYSR